jgi:murein DD-endopeptidase MepM/ murein hydrolase activator NlpD
MVLLILTLIFNLNAAISTSELKNSLSVKNSELAKLLEKVQTLEKKIGSQNDTYLQNLETTKIVENKISSLKIELNELNSNISNKYKQTFKKFALIQLENDFDDEASLAINQKLKEKISFDLNEAKSLKDQGLHLSQLLTEYQTQLEYFKSNQENLHQLIIELENEKRITYNEYESLNYDKVEIEKQMTDIKAEERAKSKVLPKIQKIAVEMPIKKFDKYVPSNKGITYHYKLSNDIQATQNGTVVYTGELANYGKVIMIDHGNEIRSVMLGDIEFKVSKGEEVMKGQVIGFAAPAVSNNENKTLYFEVRRKNIAQNTYQWLEENNPTISI